MYLSAMKIFYWLLIFLIRAITSHSFQSHVSQTNEQHNNSNPAYRRNNRKLLLNGANDHIVTSLTVKATSTECLFKPLFLTIAKVTSSLYWKLIENFFFTMKKYKHDECAALICIDDYDCMEMCEKRGFSCLGYHPLFAETDVSPVQNQISRLAVEMNQPNSDANRDGNVPIMEQVSTIKLYYMSQLMMNGVNVMLIDLDVGFLKDPMSLVDGFLSNPLENLRCQMDVKWTWAPGSETWYTSPNVNFGLFLIKGNAMSHRIFTRAWNKYQDVPAAKKYKVAIDQNIVGGALKWANKKSGVGYTWSYFDIGYSLDRGDDKVILPQKAYLLHKMGMHKLSMSDGSTAPGDPNHIRGDGTGGGAIRYQLGGEVADIELKDVAAVHATCYEKSTKLLALEVTNAYTVDTHYNNDVKTITKPLMLLSRNILKQELLFLIALATSTNRSLIIPNAVVGSIGSAGIVNVDRSSSAIDASESESVAKLSVRQSQWDILDCVEQSGLFVSKAQREMLYEMLSNTLMTSESQTLRNASLLADKATMYLVRKAVGTPFCAELFRQTSLFMFGENPKTRRKSRNVKKLDEEWLLRNPNEVAPFERGDYYWPGFRLFDSDAFSARSNNQRDALFASARSTGNLRNVAPACNNCSGEVGTGIYSHMENVEMKEVSELAKLNVLPADYYYRMQHRSGEGSVPDPFVYTIDLHLFQKSKNARLSTILNHEIVNDINAIEANRLVLRVIDSSLILWSGGDNGASQTFGGGFDIKRWSQDSVSNWNVQLRAKSVYAPVTKYDYLPLPYVENVHHYKLLRTMISTCNSILKLENNYTCFKMC